MINVATAGGAIDYWGDWPQQDYEEYSISEDEWGYVLVQVVAGDSPKFVLKRLSLGDAYNIRYNEVVDSIEIRLNNSNPEKPICISPNSIDSVNGNLIVFNSSPFIDDFDEHGGSHWQVSLTCNDFDSPIIGLTGSKEEINNIIKNFRVFVRKNKASQLDQNYLIDHSALFFLLDDNDNYLAHFRTNDFESKIKNFF